MDSGALTGPGLGDSTASVWFRVIVTIPEV
jgi:hypothetical protein